MSEAEIWKCTQEMFRRADELFAGLGAPRGYWPAFGETV
jgi:hypothetical protein